MRWRRAEPVLITSAEEARPAEIRRREQRYILTMLVRVVCFVLAVVVFTGWLRLVAVGLAVILPWIAVVIANGGPARSDRRQAGFAPKTTAGDEPRTLAAGGHRIVDADVLDGDLVDGGFQDGKADAEAADGEVVDGEVVDGEVVDGRVVDGRIVDGRIVDGEARPGR
ncbi:hypothetical protein Franean1_2240 [Parafrankia sp. EAN1pec]|uniref:DUF3099 domain-containing protein n=1 Tax=Parafrankia sp. (strain EAN1pec) TaxID=298653 RepID=UPI00005401E6|nr:hypothetical protein Franean1_2240 [Frankia sp. EAN1pec]